jgi:sterol desaturase/sphingolipid hydroxylase (fatty acid hydroxylase superfamily)
MAPLQYVGLRNSILMHMNMRLPLGPFTPLLVGPQYHRIHHSSLETHCDKNFAGWFPVLDIMFGSYYKPLPGEYPLTGLASGELPRGALHAAVWPFLSWWHLLRGASHEAPATAR